MAKLHEEVVIIKVSTLLKDGADASLILSDDILSSLEAVVQELTGANTLVEISVA
jgi:hypothetical protein